MSSCGTLATCAFGSVCSAGIAVGRGILRGRSALIESQPALASTDLLGVSVIKLETDAPGSVRRGENWSGKRTLDARSRNTSSYLPARIKGTEFLPTTRPRLKVHGRALRMSSDRVPAKAAHIFHQR